VRRLAPGFSWRDQDIIDDLDDAVLDNHIRDSNCQKAVDLDGVEAVDMGNIDAEVMVLEQCRKIDLELTGKHIWPAMHERSRKGLTWVVSSMLFSCLALLYASEYSVWSNTIWYFSRAFKYFSPHRLKRKPLTGVGSFMNAPLEGAKMVAPVCVEVLLISLNSPVFANPNSKEPNCEDRKFNVSEARKGGMRKWSIA
jgi:hypothetical protein